MDTDKKIKKAEELVEELVGVDRNEFKKWVNYLESKGDLNKGLKLAKLLSTTPMLRGMPQRTYGTIYKVMSKRKNEFMQINFSESLEILGYAERIFIGNLSKSLKGYLKGVRVGKKRRK
ncbi:MAG: hypothetical protein ACE5KE_13895 [Methanosarcinales archaeon]